jgi:aryl-alcohol dehydrogenase-like predicted oxidoreductase
MELAGGGGLIGRMFPVIPQDEENAVIKAALDGGINWFDTAEMYGAGVSEKPLATGLKAAGKSDREVVIATKWQPLTTDGRQYPAQHRRPVLAKNPVRGSSGGLPAHTPGR